MVLKNTEGVLPSHGLRALIPSLPKIFFGDRQAEKKLSNETLAPILSSVLAPSDFGAKRELELEAGATKRQPHADVGKRLPTLLGSSTGPAKQTPS